MATRLFVGNLPDNISEDDVRSAFSSYGEIINLDLKSKSAVPAANENKKFAFVTISGSNHDIETCIRHFSNTDFNGNRLYVTRARESFLERLQRERLEAQQKEAEKESNTAKKHRKIRRKKIGQSKNSEGSNVRPCKPRLKRHSLTDEDSPLRNRRKQCLVGCACGCVSWALGGVLSVAGVETMELPPARVFSWLLIDAALGPLLMDSLWLWGRSLTSSQTATGMLGLAAPMAACVDAWRVGGSAWRGAAAVLAGAGWLSAVLHVPGDWTSFITNKMRAAEGFTVIRNLQDLDEQSEALMSSDEPT